MTEYENFLFTSTEATHPLYGKHFNHPHSGTVKRVFQWPSCVCLFVCLFACLRPRCEIGYASPAEASPYLSLSGTLLFLRVKAFRLLILHFLPFVLKSRSVERCDRVGLMIRRYEFCENVECWLGSDASGGHR